MDVIFFYDEGKPYYEFSNFYQSDVNYGGKIWKTSEHLYQAQKFSHNEEFMELIRNADTPAKVYAISNQRKTQYSGKWYVNKSIYGELKINDVIDKSKQLNISIRTDWDSVKDDVMRCAVFLKFSQNPNLKALLLNTGNRYIVENSPRDSYWGCGADGNGKNMLGIILMETRARFLSQSQTPK